MRNDDFYDFEKEPNQKYEIINEFKIFFGCVIKSLYDEKRIKIKEEHDPKRIKIDNRFLYGSIFDLNKKYKKVLESIGFYKNIDLLTYDKILKENNLSCEDNFSYFSEKIYPIDPHNVHDFIKNYKYEFYFEENIQLPMYERIKAINMFIVKP
jgi:hypothetical protein